MSDTQNCVIRKIAPDSVVSTLAGSVDACITDDGIGSAAHFSLPAGLAVDREHQTVYVAQGHLVRRITADGTVTTIAMDFAGAQGVAVGDGGSIYVADTSQHRIAKIAPDGQVTTVAGTGQSGSADGGPETASFYLPYDVAYDRTSGNLYVADRFNYTIRKIAPGGIVSTLAGKALTPGYADGQGADARFDGPTGIDVDASGNIYVADVNNRRIRKITPEGMVTTFAGNGSLDANDGAALSASIRSARGVAVAPDGTVVVTDQGSNAIRRVAGGQLSTIAGSIAPAGYADGTAAAARFRLPYDVATDSLGNAYVVDFNHVIRKITPSGIVTTLAGLAGTTGSADGQRQRRALRFTAQYRRRSERHAVRR